MTVFYSRRHGFTIKKENVLNSVPWRSVTYQEPTLWQRVRFYVIGAVIVSGLLLLISVVHAEPIILKASWYSVESLKKEGTWKYSRGVMANGEKFKDEGSTCATRLFKLGSTLKITNIRNGKSVLVTVTDRIGKRFAKIRVDLSRGAFGRIANLQEGLIPVTVEVIER